VQQGYQRGTDGAGQRKVW